MGPGYYKLYGLMVKDVQNRHLCGRRQSIPGLPGGIYLLNSNFQLIHDGV